VNLNTASFEFINSVEEAPFYDRELLAAGVAFEDFGEIFMRAWPALPE
jgi:hypothetical protein